LLFEETVDLQEARTLAIELMALHPSLDGWQLLFSRQARRTLGVCKHHQRLITLATSFVELNDDATVRDIILHEIAHALVGPGHGHDATWRAKAVEIGANPDRVCTAAVMPAGDWQAVCGNCGRVFHQYRQPRRAYHCRQCGREAGALTFARREGGAS
jgi:predicted SprT family Zn-dependent metalloprotease